MDVTAKYELVGLTAYPTRRSLSPEMQNKTLEETELPLTHMAFEIDNSTFANAIAELEALKTRGTGVSIPGKQLTCKHVNKLTPVAKLVGVINTTINGDDHLRDYNTDGTGHIRVIKESGLDIKGRTTVLLDAGGASTTTGAQAAIRGIKETRLFNRQNEFFAKAQEFAKRANENTGYVIAVIDLVDCQASADTLANADISTNGTKIDMKPLGNKSLMTDAVLLCPELLATECVYNPHMTKLLQQTQNVGCKIIDGCGMLLWQGTEQFKFWIGEDFPLDYVKQVVSFAARRASICTIVKE